MRQAHRTRQTPAELPPITSRLLELLVDRLVQVPPTERRWFPPAPEQEPAGDDGEHTEGGRPPWAGLTRIIHGLTASLAESENRNR